VSLKLIQSKGESNDAEFDTYETIENIIGTNYHHDALEGDHGDNKIWGRDGNDFLWALGGDDTLYGERGSDLLAGHDGDDTLYGGDGNDTLIGGNGADIFAFTASDVGNGIDTIQDLSLVDGDKINLSDVIEGYDPLTQSITEFVQITDNGSDSILSVDANGGGENFIQVATIKNVTGLTDEESLEANGTLIA
jgi:Ca2+-binding RTX toxin-like protein